MIATLTIGKRRACSPSESGSMRTVSQARLAEVLPNRWLTPTLRPRRRDSTRAGLGGAVGTAVPTVPDSQGGGNHPNCAPRRSDVAAELRDVRAVVVRLVEGAALIAQLTTIGTPVPGLLTMMATCLPGSDP